MLEFTSDVCYGHAQGVVRDGIGKMITKYGGSRPDCPSIGSYIYSVQLTFTFGDIGESL
jgi:hypothetical protein